MRSVFQRLYGHIVVGLQQVHCRGERDVQGSVQRVKYIYLNGYDGYQNASGWYCPNAAFTVQSQDYAPQTLYVSPPSGSNQPGQIQQFTYTTSDPNGASTMYHTELVFNPGSTWQPGYAQTRRCKIIQDSDFVSLENDAQNGYVNGGYAPLGSSQPISNSQCTVYPSMSHGAATSLQSQNITFGVSFTSSFAGQLGDHIFAADNLGMNTWDVRNDGLWTWYSDSSQSAGTAGVLDIMILPGKPYLYGYARTAPNNLSYNYGPYASVVIQNLTTGVNTSSQTDVGFEDTIAAVPLQTGVHYRLSSSHSINFIPAVYGCSYCGYSDPLGYSLLSGSDLPSIYTDLGLWIWVPRFISESPTQPSFFLGNLTLDLLTYQDSNAPSPTFIYDPSAGVAMDDYGDVLPSTADWASLAQPTNPYYNTFQAAETFQNLAQACQPIGPFTLPCAAIRAGIAAGGVVAILMSQRGGGNVADTGILSRLQADTQKGGQYYGKEPCEVLDIYLSQGKAAGDTQTALKIKTTQKALGCRGSRANR